MIDHADTPLASAATSVNQSKQSKQQMAERSETSNLKDKLVAEMRSLSSRAMDKGKLAAGKAKSTARNILASKACKGQ